MTYKSKLLLNFTALFATFTLLLVLFQYNREKQFRRHLLESRLESYADVVAGEIKEDAGLVDSTRLQRLTATLPADLRLTIIGTDGKVIFESTHHLTQRMDNHLNRPEVRLALSHDQGSDIRYSTTDRRDYFYYAQNFGSHIVRVALPYGLSVQSLMKADNMFLWFVLLLFPLALLLLIRLSDHFGKAVSGLKDFMHAADRGLIDYSRIDFPHSELGEIGHAIMLKYKQLEESGRQTAVERERLLRHFHYFEEGIAFFAPDRSCIYANPRFMQYVNGVLDRPTADMSQLWSSPDFAPLLEFLALHGGLRHAAGEAPVFKFSLHAGGTTLGVQLLVHADGSFEVTLSDITKTEKNRRLKQQMSNNITHELRTPVTSIRGYLDTVLDCPNLKDERKTYFLEKARAQVLRLSDLIRDVALITKTEEAADLMPRETVNLEQVIADAREDLADLFRSTYADLQVDLPKTLSIQGNYSLVYSIFRNLMENALHYAGQGSHIRICCYNATPDFVYFSFSDTGCGVPDEHLPRIFERFYRVTEGRTRDNGGTGLGLSIVRNAVAFHGGTISVRNRKEGGLEFLFTLKK